MRKFKTFTDLALAACFGIACSVTHAQESATYSIRDGSRQIQPVALMGSGNGGDAKGSSCDSKGDCDCCDTCYLWGPDEAWTLFPETCNGITVGGWVQAGYHNKNTPRSQAFNDGLAFNDLPDRVNLHQSWLYVEKVAESDGCNWDWGFRADIVYGTDAQKTQGFGGNGWDTSWDRNSGYGWAMPQLYLEVARGDLSIIAGHFYTLVGYETVTSPDNFFYSHSLTMFNSEPFTHSGVLATYGASDNLEVYGGWTAGWDTGFETNMNGSNFLGGFSYSVSDDLSVTYISTAGNFGARGDDAYSHSVVVDMTLTERLNYVFQSDLVRVDSTRDDDVGINQYLFYSYNDCIAVGGRLEWWKDEGTSFYAATGGVNIKPHANLTVRPEIRHDWQPSANVDQTTFGIDAIVTY